MSTNIQVTIADAQPITVSFPSASSGQVLLSDFKIGKSPVESPDGSRKEFTLPDSDEYVSGYLRVFRDQAVLIPGVDFTEKSSTIFTLTDAPLSVESITMDYIKQ
jgi:hypothetical protein